MTLDLRRRLNQANAAFLLAAGASGFVNDVRGVFFGDGPPAAGRLQRRLLAHLRRRGHGRRGLCHHGAARGVLRAPGPRGRPRSGRAPA